MARICRAFNATIRSRYLDSPLPVHVAVGYLMQEAFEDSETQLGREAAFLLSTF
jgi:hypothetical protein